MMLDLDGLKLINDTHGHPIGAHTIAEVGQDHRHDRVAQHGAACRFGGDEFAAFLPGLGKRDGAKIGETIRALVAGHRFEKDGVVVRPTISIGVSRVSRRRRDRRACSCASADEALYRAKKTGRDRVRT